MALDINNLHNIKLEYQNALAGLRKNVDLELDDRRAAAHALYKAAAERQGAILDEYEAQRAARIENLHGELYDGNDTFKSAVERYATADPADLLKVASLGKATARPELVRAAAVIARHNEDESTFIRIVGNDDVLADMFRELDALNSEVASGRPHPMLPAVLAKPLEAPGGPELQDIVPTREDVIAARDEEQKAREAERLEAASVYANTLMRRPGTVKRQVGSDRADVDASLSDNPRVRGGNG